MKKINLQYMQYEIRRIGNEMRHPHTDGYVGWGLKQDLWKLHMVLKAELAKSPTYTGETEWLQEQRTAQAFEILSGEAD